MTVQNVIDEAKAYYNNDYIYVIECKRDKSAYMDQMEKVLSVRNRINQDILDISKGKIDYIMQFSKIYAFSYLQI